MKQFFCMVTGVVLLGTTAQSQFYYKDIVLNKQAIEEMATLKAASIRSVKVKSFDREDEPSAGFFCEKKIKKDYSQLETISSSYATPESILEVYFDKNGRIVQSLDSTDIATGVTNYIYDDKGNLTNITSGSRSADEDFTDAAAEQHLYFYNAANQPVKMVRVKNNKDSITVNFLLDDKGNVTEERDTRTGKTYYYYYDAKNRLTDVVYFNSGLRKLLPIITYDYNSTGQIVQMVTAEEGSTFYYTWKYTYENSLKVQEKCFYNKKGDPQIREAGGYSGQRNLQGIIKYEYR